MTAAERRAKAEAARYSVWMSPWTATDGSTGISWVITRPNGENLEDYEGSEAAGWRAAYRDMRATAKSNRVAGTRRASSLDPIRHLSPIA